MSAQTPPLELDSDHPDVIAAADATARMLIDIHERRKRAKQQDGTCKKAAA